MSLDANYLEIAISLTLVALAIGVTMLWKIPVAKDMAFGSVRAFVQLIAVGYALEFIFDINSPWLIVLVLLVMATVGAQAAVSRVKSVSGAFVVAWTAIIVGSAITLSLMTLLNIVIENFDARYVIPLAGMIISNSMNASALTIERVAADIRTNRNMVETALSLGKSWRTASRPLQQNAANAGMISILNFMKTVGIVALPGAMTGMILAGAPPLDAVIVQLIVGYMLLSAVAITSVISVELTVRKFFNREKHQLVLPSGR